MHSLLVLSAVLASLSPAEGASIPTHFEIRSSLTLPGSQRGELHLLDTPKIHARDEDEAHTLRGLVELMGGLAGELVGAVPAYYFLNNGPTLGTGGAFGLGLMILGASTGVSIAGWAMDGRGRYGFALLGSIIGLTVPLLTGVALSQAAGCASCDGIVVPIAVGMVLLTPVGATIGYEASEPTPWLSLKASRDPAPAPRVAPVVMLARQGHGVTFGLAGSL